MVPGRDGRGAADYPLVVVQPCRRRRVVWVDDPPWRVGVLRAVSTAAFENAPWRGGAIGVRPVPAIAIDRPYAGNARCLQFSGYAGKLHLCLADAVALRSPHRYSSNPGVVRRMDSWLHRHVLLAAP